MLEAATRLSRLVEKLLDLSMLQAGDVGAARGPYSLEEVLARGGRRHRGDRSRSLFRLALDDDLPPLSGDAAQVERAFANLLENAARYSGGKPVSVRAQVVGGARSRPDRRSGPGNPRRVSSTASSCRSTAHPTSRAPSGLGARSRHRAGLRRGQRRTHLVESLPGQGTSFIIDFPLGRACIAGAHAPERRSAA